MNKLRVLFPLSLFVVLLGVGGALAALPLTPNETYIANSPPVVKAATLNDLQSGIVKLFTGSHSTRALRAEGAGNVAVASPMPNGVVEVSRLGGAQTFPTPTGKLGQINVGNVPYTARVDASGGLVWGQALKSAGITKTGTGQYDVTFLLSPTSVVTTTVKAQPFGGQRRADIVNIMIPAAGELKISVEIWNTIAAPETRLDSEFMLWVTAE